MDERRLWRLGGGCAILAGILYLAVIPSSLVPLLAAGESPGALDDAATFYPLVDRVPLSFVLGGAAFGLAAILALALVPALSSIVEPRSPGWSRWTGAIAYIGFGVGSVSTLRGTDVAIRVASSYSSGDATVRSTIAALYPPASLSLDPWGLFQFGGVGLWIFTTSLLARRYTLLPSGLTSLGVAAAVLMWCQVIGDVLGNGALIGIGSLGIVVGGIWYLWIGWTLRRRPASSSESGLRAGMSRVPASA